MWVPQRLHQVCLLCQWLHCILLLRNAAETQSGDPSRTFYALLTAHINIIRTRAQKLRSPPFRIAGHLFLFPVAVSSPFSPPRRLQLACMSSLSASIPAEDGCGGAGVRAKRGRLRGLVFDMDGTLTVPVIDFGAMYRAVLGEEGYAAHRAARASAGGVDILHHIESWAPQEQQRAYEIIAHFERQGLDRLQIMPGSSFFSLLP